MYNDNDMNIEMEDGLDLFPFLKKEPNEREEDVDENLLEDIGTADENDFPGADEILREVCETGTCLSVSLTCNDKEISSGTYMDVSVDIEKHHDFMQVTVKDGSNEADIIDELYSILNSYGKAMNAEGKIKESGTDILLTFMPEKYFGEVIFGCNAPVFWALTADRTEVPVDRVIMLFGPDNVGIFSLEGEKEEEAADEKR